MQPAPYSNSYKAGVGLGLVLLASFVVMGRGLGASGAVTRIATYAVDRIDTAAHGGTPGAELSVARANPYMRQYVTGPADVMDDFLVYLLVGVIAGGFVSGVTRGRLRFDIAKGPRASNGRRLVLALIGGAISGVGARLARGCASGQALTGGASLAVGSWVFMMSFFAAAYALAYFYRKEWI